MAACSAVPGGLPQLRDWPAGAVQASERPQFSKEYEHEAPNRKAAPTGVTAVEFTCVAVGFMVGAHAPMASLAPLAAPHAATAPH